MAAKTCNLSGLAFRVALYSASAFACVAALGLFAAPAFAQANIHNGGVPLNTDQNSSNTASGTLADRGSDTNANTVPYNSAQFDFDYSLAGTATGAVWNGGVEYRVQSGTQIFYLQATNVAISQGRNANYVVRFTRGVEGLTFRMGGLDFYDSNRLTFYYQGAPINVSTAYVTGIGANGTNAISANLLGSTVLQVASTATGGTSGDLTLNWADIAVPAGVLVDRIEFTTGKNDNASGNPVNGNNTISFFNFDWLPLPIDAVDDSEDGVNGVAGQANVLNVLGNDTLDDPNTVATDVATTTSVSITQDATSNPNVTLDEATGQISVAAGTAVGTYTVNYTICENNTVPANCDSAVATITVGPAADLSITKTNGTTQVTSGSTITYNLVASNEGGDPIAGAIVTDTPGAGITCSASAPVTITGDGVPAGSFTFADLSGSGITLGTLTTGQTATLTYDCQVN